jgi:hypothetical protein
MATFTVEAVVPLNVGDSGVAASVHALKLAVFALGPVAFVANT